MLVNTPAGPTAQLQSLCCRALGFPCMVPACEWRPFAAAAQFLSALLHGSPCQQLQHRVERTGLGVLDFFPQGKMSVFYIASCRFLQLPFIRLQKFSSVLVCREVPPPATNGFYHEQMLSLHLLKLIMFFFFLQYVKVMHYIDFLNTKPTLHS